MERVKAALKKSINIVTARVGKFTALFERFIEQLRQLVSPFEAEAMGFMLAFALSFAVLYCLVTAHDIPVSGGGIFFGCVFISAAAAVFFLARALLDEKAENKPIRIALSVGAPAALLFIGWLLRKPIADSARVALPIIAHNYGFTLDIAGEDLILPETATLFMLCVALLPILITVWTVVRARSPFIAAVGSVPIFALSIISFAQLPAPWAVCLFVFVLGLLALTARARRHSDEAGFRHVFRIAPVLAVFILAIGLFLDPSQYKTPEWLENLQNRTYAAVDTVLGRNDHNEFNYIDTTGIVAGNRLDLSELSDQQKLGISVMSVRASDNKPYYLRAMSYAGYSGNEWKVLSERSAERINQLIASPLTEEFNDINAICSIVIRTEELHPYIFTPYYAGAAPEGAVPHGDAGIKNLGGLMVYHFARGSLPSRETYVNDYSLDSGIAAQYRELVEDFYLDIPSGTAEKLLAIAAENDIIPWETATSGISLDNPIYAAEVVERAADFVRNCAVYSLEPEPVPEGADFPVWFLSEAESGYCTHFAASGALLLRAIGIPARLTTGYYVAASGEEWRHVTSDDAHAWVEYYLPNTGWQVLEVTGRYADGSISGTGEEADGPQTSATATTVTTTTTTTTAATASEASGSDTTTVPSTHDTSETSNSPGTLSASDSGTDGMQSEGEKGQKSTFGRFILIIMSIVLTLAAVYGVLFLARWLIISRRRESFETGSTNQRVIAMWENILRLSKITKEEPPERITDIMLKARFSQHEISVQELAQVRRYMEKTIQALESSHDWLSKLVYKYVMFYY